MSSKRNVSTPDVSTLDFSTMNFPTPDFSTPYLGLESPGLRSLGLKSSWLKSLGLKDLGLKVGVEKSRVEMSFNREEATEAPSLADLACRAEETVLGIDPCKCELRLIGKGDRARCRCVKPTCYDVIENPYGSCKSKNRCLNRPRK